MKSFVFSILLTMSLHQITLASHPKDLADLDQVMGSPSNLKRERGCEEDSFPPAKLQKKESPDCPDVPMGLTNSNDMQIDTNISFSCATQSHSQNETIEPQRQPIVEQETKFKVLPMMQIDSFEEDELGIDGFLEMRGTKIALFDLDKTLLRDKLLFHNFAPDDQDIILDGYYQSGNFKGTREQFERFKMFMKEKGGDLERIKQNVFINEKTLDFIKELEKNGVIVGILTARHFFVAPQTDENLNKNGMNVSELSRMGECKIPYLDHPDEVGVHNGAFYTHDLFYKVQAIPYFVDLIATQNNFQGPFSVVHFDDSKDEINAFLCPETLPPAIPGRSITCVPVHYEGHYHYMSKVFNEHMDLLYQEIDEAWHTYNLQKKTNTYRDQYLKFCQQHQFIF